MLIEKFALLSIDLNAKTQSGESAFHMVCKNGHLKMAELIIQKSAKLNIDINGYDHYGNTAFHLACQKSHFEIAKALVLTFAEINVDIDLRNDNDYTAFYQLCQYECYKREKIGHSKLVALFLQEAKKFNTILNAKNDGQEIKLLHIVCEYGHFEICRYSFEK